MTDAFKIHFIHFMQLANSGDIYNSPLRYFPEFLDIAPCVKHNIKTIEWELIDPKDIVILGGGGLINNWMNPILDRLLDSCDTVVGWGLGDHAKPGKTGVPVIDYGRFSLLGVRDYNFTPVGFPPDYFLPYLPCVTCMEQEFTTERRILRDIGVIQHFRRDLPEELTSRYDAFRQSSHIKQCIRFIGESNAIVTNSYHAAYWGLLLKRIVVIMDIEWSHKFEYFKYKPVKFTGDLHKDIASGQIYSDALSDARALNVEFYEKVRAIIPPAA